ncbi:MAG: hypothetical protein WBW61_09605 [Rhodanobacteraceae bacterium]
MRRLSFAMATLCTWALLAGWAANLEWSAPLTPARRMAFDGNDFAAVIGSADAHATRLRISAAGVDATSLQSLAGQRIHAADFSLLRYRFAGLPRTREVSFIFRRADRPGDVQAVSLPWPGDHQGSFDLGQVPAWRGVITEIGIAEYPTPQLAPPALKFRSFELVGVTLWSTSWRGDFDALIADWFGDWPWSQRSVHALGRDSGAIRGHSAVLFTALAAAGLICWGGVLGGLRRRRLLAACAVVSVAVGWFALDLRWQSGLAWRLSAARAVYATHSLSEREHRVADADIEAAAERVAITLRNEPPQTRILVQSGATYELLRLIWHLLPRNVGVYPLAAASGIALPPGTIVVAYDTDDWRLAPDHASLLTSDGARLTGTLLLASDGLLVWRTPDIGQKRPLMGSAGFDGPAP